jgi:hypothetical protein
MTDNITIPRKNFITMTDIKLKPLKIKFDITTLNMIISFIYKDSVLRTRKTLSNIYKLFNNLDESLYEEDELLKARIWIIQKTLYSKLIDGFENTDNMKQYCIDDIECDELRKTTLINILETKKISHDESKHLVKKIDDTLEFGYTVTVKDVIKQILATIDEGDFRSYRAVSEDLYDIATAIINIKRNNTSLGSDQTFSLADEQFDAVVEEAVQKLKDRNRIFITGIQRLNTILAPGYLSKRLYTYLAFPGKGKSTILLKSAIDIRRYNKGIKTKDPDKRPAVLFLTLENDIPETIERIYNMAVDSDDIRNYSPKQIKKKMREKGGLKLTSDDNIDIIIKEYKNRELDTNDLYTIINDLADEGIEVITLILDYMKRIRPAEKAKDEKTELKNITNELKEVAKYFDIPVITAQQLNRVGASVVDAALQAKKEDVTKLVGRDAVAGAWEIIENSDVVIIINPETKIDTGELFLTFKLLKRRYRSSEENEKLRRLEYFNHPFEAGNEIRLIDDVELPKSLSLESLASEFESTEDKRGQTNATARESKDKGRDRKTLNFSTPSNDFDPFDFNKTSNY